MRGKHGLICIKYLSTKNGKQESNKIYHSEGISILLWFKWSKWNQFFYCNNGITEERLDYIIFSTKFQIVNSSNQL